jgi:hypothetical protein
MYGALPDHDRSDDSASVLAEDNARLAELVPEARVAFEFLCATWPEVFMAQAGAALAQLGLPRLGPFDSPSMRDDRESGDD